jgi:transcription initiation factor TFIIIB Brf1 subunit/transcription initiation factor TFIIB
MIFAECPHCGRKHILSTYEMERLIKSGKLVIADCACGMMYTIEQDDDCYFTR